MNADKIILRPMVKVDVPKLYAMYLDYPLMISTGKVYGIDWLERVCQDDGQFRFSIEVANVMPATLVGAATLWWANRDNGILSPTMWISNKWQGKGIGSQVLRQLWDQAIYYVPGMRKFSAGVFGYNERSLKMCCRFFGEPEATIPREVFWNGQYFDRVLFAKYR